MWNTLRGSNSEPPLRKSFCLSKPDKILGTKIFLQGCTEIYRHLLSRYFKNAVLGRQEMMQCKYFFWNQTENCWLENLSSEKGFWLHCESILFSVSSELRFLKWVRFFERNSIVKWVIFLASFCWVWGFLLENKKNKKNSDNVHWNVWTNIKKLYARNRNNIFQKKNSKYEILNHLYFGSNFVF